MVDKIAEKATKAINDAQSEGYDPTDPYNFFKATSHELTAHDASFQLLQGSDELVAILAKTNIPSLDFLIRVAQAVAKLEECDLGERADPPYNAPMKFIKNVLNGLPSIEGFARSEFIQALGRLFAPSVWELKKTGKISGGGKAGKAKYNVLKSHEDKPHEEGETQ
jgi:hypothetical protein